MKPKEIYLEERNSQGELIRHFYEIIKILKETDHITEFEANKYLPRQKHFMKGIFLTDKRDKLRKATEAEKTEYEQAKVLWMLRNKI